MMMTSKSKVGILPKQMSQTKKKKMRGMTVCLGGTATLGYGSDEYW